MALPTTLAAGRIMAMPAGREMDAMVAERVFGQTVDRTPLPPFHPAPRIVHRLDPIGRQVPDYSTSMNMAMAVMTWLRERWGSFGLSGEVINDVGQWVCSPMIPIAGRNFHGFGDTPELAICRAALLTVMERPDA